jgi:hypothetical protein
LNIYGTRPDNQEEVLVGTFKTPPGLGIDVAPLPVAQVNLGLFRKTEVMVRYLPEINFKKGQINMWGLGLKHSISQWIPVTNKLPFDITAAAAYTDFKTSYDLNLQPETEVQGWPVVQSNASFNNQQLQLSTKAYFASLVVSKTIAILTVYGGLNYSQSETKLVAAGLYPVTSVRNKTPTPESPESYELYVRELQNPLDIAMHQSQAGLTAGFRLKLAILSFNAEGTLARYPSATAGIGIGFN